MINKEKIENLNLKQKVKHLIMMIMTFKHNIQSINIVLKKEEVTHDITNNYIKQRIIKKISKKLIMLDEE